MTTNTEKIVKDILARVVPIVESVVYHIVQQHLNTINHDRANGPDRSLSARGAPQALDGSRSEKSEMRISEPTAVPNLQNKKITIQEKIFALFKDDSNIALSSIGGRIDEKPDSVRKTIDRLCKKGALIKKGNHLVKPISMETK